MDRARLAALIAEEEPRLRAIRHDLHAHPELGYQEQRTSQAVQRELSRLGVAFKAGLAGGTGVVGHLPASVTAAPGGAGAGETAVGLRADMDALPIAERTGAPYASRYPGVMHACGHDGHTAILLGVAGVLSRIDRPRPVTLVFQPAEEGGAGGERLCREGLLRGGIIGPPIARMYGLHGWPDLALGRVATRPGPLLASTDEFRVCVRGTQAHAAFPQHARDPVVSAAACISALQTIVSRNVAPHDAAVVSVCTVNAGTASNVIPEEAVFGGTVRALRAATRDLLRARLIEIVRGVCAAHGCTAEVEWHEGYPVTHNDPAATEAWFGTARAALGEEAVGLVEHPTMGGEDFAFYAREVPSVFFYLGLRPPDRDRVPTLHQPDFDFDDRAIPTGVELFVRLATA